MSNSAQYLSQTRLDREVRRAELAGARLVSRLTRRLVSQALDSVRARRLVVSTSGVEREFVDALSRAMLVAHVAGRERADREATRLAEGSLRLDALDDVISRIKKAMAAPVPRVRAVLKTYRDLAEASSTKAIGKVTEGVREVIAEQIRKGAHLKTAKRAIRERLKQLGALDPGDHLLNTVFRTHTQLANQAAHWQRLEQTAPSLWGYMYSTAGDERVRAGHEALDGMTLPKNHRIWNTAAPPNGHNCRCYLIPIFSPEPMVLPKPGWEVDKDFRFNPGKIFAA